MTPELINGNTYVVVVEPTVNPSVIVDYTKVGATGATGPGVPTDGTAGQILVSNGGVNTYWANSDVAANLTGYVTTTNLTNNLANYVTTNDINTTLANYQQKSTLSANVATLTSNSANYIGSLPAANVVSNAQLSANLSAFATTTSVNSASATAYSNAVSYVDGKSYVNTSQLSSNLASYLVTNTAINTGNVSVTGNITLTGNISGNTAGFAIGYRDVPQNFTNTSFTLGLTDAGKHILTQNSGSSTQTITVPNNSSVAYSTGAAISIVVQSTGTVAVANGAGVTMYLAGNSTAKSTITLNSYSMATVMKIGTDTWIVSGTGAT